MMFPVMVVFTLFATLGFTLLTNTKQTAFSSRTSGQTSETPAPLIPYREDELVTLRGNGAGELKEWDRVYDYAYYNDLGEPDKGAKYVRPVLGGSSEYPYPRRGRTGRPPTKTGGIKLPEGSALDNIRENIPFELLKELFQTDAEDKTAWRTDQEFGREMLAGVNPVIIKRLQEFPPTSNLDPKVYGNQNSAITRDHIENNLDGWTIEEPLAIELSLPNPKGDQFGAISKVYTPAEDGVEASVWQLAKAYVAVNDSGYHQLISHWLNTHATIEPFVIATNRQLSVLHPIHKLLHPHFRDTMNINALARQALISAGGLLEITVFPGKYAMEMSSVLYKNWVFPEQGLPADLIKRGVAIEDEDAPHGLRLLIKDYPYAVDGLKIWSAIETWVHNYCHFYYTDDRSVQVDSELQSWWKELREEGHGDKKDEPWWPKMQTVKDLIDSCTTIIWVGSALHAAVNFGQYPSLGTARTARPSAVGSCPNQAAKNSVQAFDGRGLSWPERHTRVDDGPKPLEAFGRFGKDLGDIEDEIVEMNGDEKLRNRVGPVKMPYTLLFPTSQGGLTGKGIPNSVSI
ncbi:hypothetical protein C3L33_09069, partial [Rhododendron williamsianum]